MNLKLVRKIYGLYGVLGELYDEQSNLVCVTLEHAFPDDNGGFAPKLAAGTYICQRGTHLLEPTDTHPNPQPFSTFEITNVPPFQGKPVTKILFHIGNYNKDSNGCVLLGLKQGAGAILESAAAFEKFTELEKDVDTFTLSVM